MAKQSNNPSDQDSLARGIEFLSAEKESEDYYRYTADEDRTDYRVDEREVTDLGRRLLLLATEDDDTDMNGTIYSVWCGDTDSRPVERD